MSAGSPQEGIPSGALAGTDTGLSADASVGVGLGGNVIIGGTNRAFMLQPTSYEGRVGLNVAAGVTTVTLNWAPQLTEARLRRSGLSSREGLTMRGSKMVSTVASVTLRRRSIP